MYRDVTPVKNANNKNSSTSILKPGGLTYLTNLLTTGHMSVTALFTLFCLSVLQAQPHEATVGGVTYWWNDTQSSLGCPCKKGARRRHQNDTDTVIYVSYSAVNISVIARNLVGYSPPALIQVPAESTSGLKCRWKYLSCFTYHEYLPLTRSRPLRLFILFSPISMWPHEIGCKIE